MTNKLGLDVGGTFTDVLWAPASGAPLRAKVPSTPHDPSEAVLNGIAKVKVLAQAQGREFAFVLNHGTTVATNAILEGKGAKVALLVTAGYKDVLQVRRFQVPGGLAGWIVWPKPAPLARLELTVEVPGRIGSNGAELYPFEAETLRQRVRELKEEGVDAVTVSLINAFANDWHEKATLQIVAEELPGVPVSLSSEVLPELQEYERTLTTVANSYVRPKSQRISTICRRPLARTFASMCFAPTAVSRA